MSWARKTSNHVWVVPVESGVIEPGDRAAFDCKVGGPAGQVPKTGLWVSPEIEHAFVLEEVERTAKRFRVLLHCIAPHPTAFRGHLFVVFDDPHRAAAKREPPS